MSDWGIHPPLPPGSAMPCTKSITWNGGGMGEHLGSLRRGYGGTFRFPQEGAMGDGSPFFG